VKIELNFQISDELQYLLDIIDTNKGTPRFVGGIVRDVLSNLPISDIDIATSLKPQQLIDIFQKENIKYVDTGSKFGTITAIIGRNIPVEITTLRIDTKCDGRHAEVKFTDDFKEDAKRRDFTINAMSYCPYAHELFDYFGGYEDLKNKKVEFIGDPNERILEDHLRILRFFRFSDRFASYLDAKSLKACIDHKCLVGSLSKERVKSELDKMITSSTAHKIFALMVDNAIMEEILDPKPLDLELMQLMPAIKNLRYAAMLHKAADIREILSDLKFSNHEKANIVALAHFRNFYGDLSLSSNLKMIFMPLWVNKKKLEDYFDISNAKSNKAFKEVYEITSKVPPLFPINGDDLIKIGKKGADIGLCIDALKQRWIESDFELAKQDLLKLLQS